MTGLYVTILRTTRMNSCCAVIYVTLRHGSTSHVTSLSGDQLGHSNFGTPSGERRELNIERNSRFGDPLVLSQRRLHLNFEYQLWMSIISLYSTEVVWSVKLCSWWRSTLYEQNSVFQFDYWSLELIDCGRYSSSLERCSVDRDFNIIVGSVDVRLDDSLIRRRKESIADSLKLPRMQISHLWLITDSY